MFGPPATIAAYFYTRFLESGAEARIPEYLSKKETVVEKALTIAAE